MLAKHSAEFSPKLLTMIREGYSWDDLRADVLAGLTVAIVALPLSMAIAIASGVGPERGSPPSSAAFWYRPWADRGIRLAVRRGRLLCWCRLACCKPGLRGWCWRRFCRG